jgi:hypothetical protein
MAPTSGEASPGRGPEMTEPLFFDCLTDAQVWSLFDTGGLNSYMLPARVYERLERIAPDHGCYLFTWPADSALPSLADIVPGVALPVEEPPARPHGRRLETRLTAEQMRLAMAAFCTRLHPAVPHAGGRIHVIATHPRPALRRGPCLEPPAHDLNAMSLPELEAYLDDVLRLDEHSDAALNLPEDSTPSLRSMLRSTSLGTSQRPRHAAQAREMRSD